MVLFVIPYDGILFQMGVHVFSNGSTMLFQISMGVLLFYILHQLMRPDITNYCPFEPLDQQIGGLDCV